MRVLPFTPRGACAVCHSEIERGGYCGFCLAEEARLESKRIHNLFEMQPRARMGIVTHLPTPLMFRIQDLMVSVAARYPHATALAIALGVCAVVRLF